MACAASPAPLLAHESLLAPARGIGSVQDLALRHLHYELTRTGPPPPDSTLGQSPLPCLPVQHSEALPPPVSQASQPISPKKVAVPKGRPPKKGGPGRGRTREVMANEKVEQVEKREEAVETSSMEHTHTEAPHDDGPTGDTHRRRRLTRDAMACGEYVEGLTPPPGPRDSVPTLIDPVQPVLACSASGGMHVVKLEFPVCGLPLHEGQESDCGSLLINGEGLSAGLAYPLSHVKCEPDAGISTADQQKVSISGLGSSPPGKEHHVPMPDNVAESEVKDETLKSSPTTSPALSRASRLSLSRGSEAEESDYTTRPTRQRRGSQSSGWGTTPHHSPSPHRPPPLGLPLSHRRFRKSIMPVLEEIRNHRCVGSTNTSSIA